MVWTLTQRKEWKHLRIKKTTCKPKFQNWKYIKSWENWKLCNDIDHYTHHYWRIQTYPKRMLQTWSRTEINLTPVLGKSATMLWKRQEPWRDFLSMNLCVQKHNDYINNNKDNHHHHHNISHNGWLRAKLKHCLFFRQLYHNNYCDFYNKAIQGHHKLWQASVPLGYCNCLNLKK